jgi:hypothetical protein
MSWKIEGTDFESCNCEAACPCVFLSKPTDGECGVMIAWHINKGKFEDVALDGLSVAFAVRSPGHMAQVKWDAAVCLDERANEKQKEALSKIFAGQAGGHPAALASHMGNIPGLASVPIEHQAKGKQRSMKIPNVAEASIEALEGQGGAEITVTNHPLRIAPGNPAVTARSKKLSYKDHGMSWELSGKNGFFSPFQYAA